MLGSAAALPCTYNVRPSPQARLTRQYTSAFSDVSSYISFCQQLTRWGESGVYGFLGHVRGAVVDPLIIPQLNDQSAASLLLSSIVTEARQQFGFRALQGLQPITECASPG